MGHSWTNRTFLPNANIRLIVSASIIDIYCTAMTLHVSNDLNDHGKSFYAMIYMYKLRNMADVLWIRQCLWCLLILQENSIGKFLFAKLSCAGFNHCTGGFV